MTHPEHRSILVLDIEGYGRLDRTDPVRVRLHRRVDRLSTRMLRKAGATEGRYARNDTGDGFLITVEAQVAKTKLLTAVDWLAGELARGNRRVPADEQVRLRVALHAGEVLGGPSRPLYGGAVVFACRLLDAGEARACLQATGQPLVLVVSQTIYDDVVWQRFRGIDPAGYHAVIVRTKEGRRRAWVHLPGDLDAPTRAGVVASAAAMASGDGPIPRQLPSATPGFTGRDAELARLDELLGAASPRVSRIALVHGQAGAGKSALAVEAAHRLAERFPDGQLYFDLRGPPHGLEPLAPLEVLQQSLRALGFPGDAVPGGLLEAAATYRSTLAERRLLIMLDNARDAAQVRLLLPGHPSCAVLITSQATLGELDGVVRLPLGLLDAAASVRLLERLAGPGQAAGDPEAIAEIARRCGYLPLALRIAGARLGLYPGSTPRALADRLADERGRLNELRHGDLAVRASFQLSYGALKAGPQDLALAARLFRLLALLPGPGFTVTTAAVLLGRQRSVTESAIERLVAQHLVEPLPGGNVQLHDLLRLFAIDQLETDEPAGDQLAARLRVLRYYQAATGSAAALLRPGRTVVPDPDPPQGGLAFSGYRTALDWLDAERANLIGAIQYGAALAGDPAARAAELSLNLVDYLDQRSAWDDWERLNLVLLQVARDQRDQRLAGSAWNSIGRLAQRRRDYRAAVGAFEQSLALRQAAADLIGEANVRSNLGSVLRAQSRHDDALACYRRSLAIYRRLRHRLKIGQTLTNLANVYREQGRVDRAQRAYRQSLTVCREYGDQGAMANALHGLGLTYRAQGRAAEAIACFEQELTISRELAHSRYQADALHAIGDVHADGGMLVAAIHAYRDALAVRRQSEDPRGTGMTLSRLGIALRFQGHGDLAARYLQEALAIFEHLQSSQAEAIRPLLMPP